MTKINDLIFCVIIFKNTFFDLLHKFFTIFVSAKFIIMKKLIFISALFMLLLLVQSCCVTANCPGVAQTESQQNDS
tara:strand:+ start:113 stop:340 length:228 start_codon:yes stop_codon:yes gene_type:complete